MNQQNIERCIANSIEIKLRQLHRVTKECSIYRVSKRLLNAHPTAYQPQAISIGPFHHGREDLKVMERLKLEFLDSYLLRIGSKEIKDVVGIVLNLEENARKCYEDLAKNMEKEEFVEMMVVDGCFLVEFLVVNFGQFNSTDHDNERSLKFRALNTNLYHDLIMLENQLPFFVLQGLFRLIHQTINNVSFIDVIHKSLTNMFVKHYGDLPDSISSKEINHLLDFLSSYFDPPTDFSSHALKVTTQDELQNNWLVLPPSATELCEAGVKFEKATKEKSTMGITFEAGVLRIPPFDVNDTFEIYLRNLMAFENYFKVESQFPRYIIHYVLFLGALISTEKDSSLLAKEGIVTNLIGGSDVEISILFNDIGKGVDIHEEFYYFKDISEVLHDHCKRRRNRWMASLKREYFNTPWALISFVAASLLIILTFLQTLFSGISSF